MEKVGDSDFYRFIPAMLEKLIANEIGGALKINSGYLNDLSTMQIHNAFLISQDPNAFEKVGVYISHGDEREEYLSNLESIAERHSSYPPQEDRWTRDIFQFVILDAMDRKGIRAPSEIDQMILGNTALLNQLDGHALAHRAKDHLEFAQSVLKNDALVNKFSAQDLVHISTGEVKNAALVIQLAAQGQLNLSPEDCTKIAQHWQCNTVFQNDPSDADGLPNRKRRRSRV